MWRNAKTLGEVNIRHIMEMPFWLYSIAGIKLIHWDDEDRVTTREKLSLVFVTVILILGLVSKCSFMIFEQFESSVHLSEFIIYLSFSANGLCKLTSVWLGRQNLFAVIMDLKEMFPKNAQQRRDYQLREHYDTIRRCMRFIFAFHWTVAFMFLIFPITQSVFEYLSSWPTPESFIYRFPYILKYPFNDHTPLGFIFAYFIQFMGGSTVTCYYLGADLLLMASVHLLSMQFTYLANRIRNFKALRTNEDLKELKFMLQQHSKVLRYSQRIDKVFSLSILLNYLMTILIVCLIGFQLVVGTEYLDIFKFVGFLGSSLVHIYFICYFSTNLMTESSGFSKAIFAHEWYCTVLPYQRMLPLAIARAQKPAVLTAYKFFDISMETFTSLITTSYQFFTLIKTNYDKANATN